MTLDDLSYYRHRADRERQRASEANRSDVAAIHEELARQYEALIQHPQLWPSQRRESATEI